jgi:hypothetical protein
MDSIAISLEEENLKLQTENIMLKKLLDLSEKNLLQIAYMASGSSRSIKSEEKSVEKVHRTAYSRNIKNDLFLKTLRQKEFKTVPSKNLEGKIGIIDFTGLPMEQSMVVASGTVSGTHSQVQRRSSRKKTLIVKPLHNY